MSHQALMLNHPREALQLATTGRHGLTKAYSAACASRLFALEAGAHAALGDATAATRAVAESERAFESINAGTEPEWARFIDSAYLSGEWANTFASLHQSTEATRCARRSIADASQHHRARREVFSQTALAQAALERRDLDSALRAAHRAIDLSITVQSSRCLSAVSDLRSQLSPYRTVTAVREFDDYARETLTHAHPN